MDQTRLGRLDEGLTQFKQALAILETLTHEDPANPSYQQSLMSTYSHLGDALGNPKWRNLGDAEGALSTYRQMLAVAAACTKPIPRTNRRPAITPLR
jgi:hypothetical protein